MISRFLGDKNSVRSRILTGYFWTIVSAVAAKLVAVVASYYIARSVGREVYGEFGILQNTINTLGVFAGFGIGVAATKYIAQYRHADREKASRILSINVLVSLVASGLLAIVVFLFASQIASIIANPGLVGYLRIGSLTLFFASLNGAMSGVFAGLEKFKIISALAFITSLISSFMQCVLVNKFGLGGVICGILSAQCLVFLLSAILLKEELKISKLYITFYGLKAELKTLLAFNIPSILGSIMVSPINWVCAAILVNQKGGYLEMGLFTAANQWRLALLFIPMSLGKVLLSILSNLNAEGNGAGSNRVLMYNIYVTACLSVLTFIFAILFGDYIMGAYGSGFEGSANVLMVLVAVAGLTAINSVIGTALQSKGLVWVGFGFNALWGIQLLAWSYFLCPKLGALGLALANLLSYLGHSVLQFSFVKSNKYRYS